MKTPDCPVWDESQIQLSNTELRERKLVKRLSNRKDVREILLVMTPALKLLETTGGDWLVTHMSSLFHSNLSQISHWAINIGDNYFELHRAASDQTRTELLVSKWTPERRELISHTYPQGVTALDDWEIRAIGQRYFSKLNRMHINKYDVWKNNCHVAVDSMLHEIGGLSRHRKNLISMEEWTRQFFCESMMIITRLWYRLRGCDEGVIEKHEISLRSTLEVLTPVSRHYPKRQWIREDINEAVRTSSGKLSVIGGHWYLSVLESALSLRKHTEASYIKPGVDGKPELRFDLVQEAVKGIWNGNEASKKLAWLKALPWLTAGFVVGTPRWAFAVIYLVCESGVVKMKNGSEQVLAESRTSPSPGSPDCASTSTKRKGRNARRRKSRSKSSKSEQDRNLVERYERRITSSGVPYFVDHVYDIWSWDTPEHQELCFRIKDVPLPKRWEERQEGDGPRFYIHSITGEIRNSKPGPSEVWVVKKKIQTGWVKSSVMPLPAGWELCRTNTGEKYYVNHNNNPPTSTSVHPIAQEIDEERKILLPEWNVEWDEERGKKYRNMQTHEIHWKAVDGPRYNPEAARPKLDSSQRHRVFVEPLPTGWTSTVEDDGKVFYINAKKMERRINHPYSDKRRRLLPQWEMRYTKASRRYWVHHGENGRGTTWWTRNKLVKNTSLKNNACGWKQAKHGEWEWFEGGDAPHTGIPTLDLDDPADFEFREYPFLSPRELQSLDGSFLEPLPYGWILRHIESGVKYYYNFKTETALSEHPYERERQDLPALWEMRWTRHGKQYYINHDTGLTWWTNPRVDKHEHKLRADAKQKQDGWKWDEEVDCWVRFQELPHHETADTTSPNLASSDRGSIGGYSEIEMRQIIAQTRDWLKEVDTHELFSEVQTQLKERGNQKLSSTTQWLKDRGGKLGEDQKVAKMRQWMKERSASETLGTLKKEVKSRQSYLHSLSAYNVKGGSKENLNGLDELQRRSEEVHSSTLQASNLPSPDHHKYEDTTGDYFQLRGINTKGASNTSTPSVVEPQILSERITDSCGFTESPANIGGLESQPSNSLETPSATRKEKLSIFGQHIKGGRDILSRHASGILAQGKAEMEQKWRDLEEKNRLVSEQKLAQKGKSRKEGTLSSDKRVKSSSDKQKTQDSAVKGLGLQAVETTSANSVVPERQGPPNEMLVNPSRQTRKAEGQSHTVAALSTSSEIATDVSSKAEREFSSKDPPRPSSSSMNKSMFGKVNVLLGTDGPLESTLTAGAEGGRKWLRKAWAKV